MKTYTIWTKACSFLAIAGILLTAYPTTANAANPVPFADSFETYSPGQILAGNGGWDGNTNSVIFSSNYTFSATTFPLDGDAHTKIVTLNTEGQELTNSFNEVTTSGVWLDIMIQPTLWTDETPPAFDSEARFMAYFNTNGNLVIGHTEATSWGIPVTLNTNRYTEITSGSINTGDWVRLTVTFNFDARTFGTKFFRVYTNGVPVNSAYGIVDPAQEFSSYGGTPGPWHLVANHAATLPSYSNLVVSGTGFLDDLVITNGMPAFSPAVIKWLISRTLNPAMGGSMSPSTNFYVLDGESATNVFYASNFWDLAYADDSGTSNNPVSGVDYVINNVTSAHTIAVFFTPQTVTNSTPKWWLAAYGTNPSPDDAYALEDDDLDGMLNWQEWVASTDPENSNMTFRIAEHYLQNGTNYVKWVSGAVDTSLPPFTVELKTNLITDSWTPATGGSVPRVPGDNVTNIWEEQNPPTGVPAYYRIKASNN